MPASPDVLAHEDAAAAMRVIVRFLAAVVAVVLAAGVGLLVERNNDQDSASGASSRSTASSLAAGPNAGDPAVVQLPRTVGPAAGTDVAPYIQARRAALAGAVGKRAAVVSFTRYVPEAEARRLLPGVSVNSLLVAAPGGDPQVVHGSLDAWAKSERADVVAQQHEFEQLIASKSVDDPAFLDQYRQEVARLTRLRRTLDPNGPIVFGAVVIGDAPALQALAAAAADVRLVDVAPGEAVPPDGDLRGLRPEEITRASDPATRP